MWGSPARQAPRILRQICACGSIVEFSVNDPEGVTTPNYINSVVIEWWGKHPCPNRRSK